MWRLLFFLAMTGVMLDENDREHRNQSLPYGRVDGFGLVASTVAEILPNMDNTSLEAKMQTMQKAYQTWRQASKQRLHAGQLLELFGLGTGMQGCPTGSWSKFNDTRILMSFPEWFLRKRYDYVPTEITEEALKGLTEANVCFQVLYSSGYWLTTEEAALAGQSGLNFWHPTRAPRI